MRFCFHVPLSDHTRPKSHPPAGVRGCQARVEGHMGWVEPVRHARVPQEKSKCDSKIYICFLYFFLLDPATLRREKPRLTRIWLSVCLSAFPHTFLEQKVRYGNSENALTWTNELSVLQQAHPVWSVKKKFNYQILWDTSSLLCDASPAFYSLNKKAAVKRQKIRQSPSHTRLEGRLKMMQVFTKQQHV